MAQLTVREAAKLLPHTSGYEVGQLVRQGKLAATKIGNRLMIEAEEMERYARERAGVRDLADSLRKIEELEAEVAELHKVLGAPFDPASRWRVRAIRAEWELENGPRKRASLGNRVRWLIFERDGHRCVYCGAEPSDGAKLTIDHRVPVVDGGTDDPDNLCTACWDCNRAKLDRPLFG